MKQFYQLYQEKEKSVSLLAHKCCEELSHPHLFPTGKFGYMKRDLHH